MPLTVGAADITKSYKRYPTKRVVQTILSYYSNNFRREAAKVGEICNTATGHDYRLDGLQVATDDFITQMKKKDRLFEDLDTKAQEFYFNVKKWNLITHLKEKLLIKKLMKLCGGKYVDIPEAPKAEYSPQCLPTLSKDDTALTILPKAIACLHGEKPYDVSIEKRGTAYETFRDRAAGFSFEIVD